MGTFMVKERDDEGLEPWPGEIADPVRDAVGNLLVAIVENTAEESPERKRAMNEALDAHRRIIDAMRDRRTLN
jgi:hypothetical protein